jgi:hypothetical protein
MRLAWFAAIFAAVSAIAGFAAAGSGFWSAYEAREQTKIAEGQERLETTAVIVRFCDAVSTDLVRTGDDLILVSGPPYGFVLTHLERRTILSYVDRHVRHLIECRFTNASRVPLLNVSFQAELEYADGKKGRLYWDQPYPDLEPGETRTVWVVSDSESPVSFSPPATATYYRFPDMTRLQHQTLLPPVKWSYLVTRSLFAGQ